MSKTYKILELYDYNNLFTDHEQSWISIGEPHIVWLNEQDHTQFLIQEDIFYEFDSPGLPLKSEIYITFNNSKLETEFLLRFGDRIITKPRVS